MGWGGCCALHPVVSTPEDDALGVSVCQHVVHALFRFVVLEG
jgi:hypothetical protein